ncbi:subtilisin-like protease SBT5.4 isoform X2 [Ziziphus jujuba]|uniref:Subtilisin-like protease SBT5.4 isoform X2 n=1 Tax=Ziziphus jujuba TaxID=326968 RepID=A0ABM3I0G4_ZIZJJ|nr:subtilisin-like protease SBT5.4 isoform X2 [Ziziphus jujuba]
MDFSVLPSLLLSLLLFSLLQTSTLCIRKPYIVYLGAHSHGSDPSAMDLQQVRYSHYDFLSSFLGSDEKAKDVMFYSYSRHINGFAAVLEENEAAQIAKHPSVLSVFQDKGINLQTTRSWNFLGLEGEDGSVPSNSIWKKARFGEHTIIGNIDTGVWPESKSFSDKGMGPIPSKWRGMCQQDTKGVSCNRKLIGARYFNKAYAVYAGPLNSSFFTSRDYDGHGSHALSTAGGSFVPAVSVFGNGNGTTKGGSPKAHVAAYKVCWPPIGRVQCFEADVLAAFDAAISDGVDVISVSLGGASNEFFESSISIGSFHAVQKGIIVVSAGGNSGPDPGSILNVSPWMLTVGASTIDREFTSYVTLGKKQLRGESMSDRGLPSEKFYPLINAVDAKAFNVSARKAQICEAGTLDPKKVEGKILVCLREYDDSGRTRKGEQAALAGAVGMILVNDELSGNDVVADPHVLPVSHINFTDGKYVFDYIKTTKAPMAYMSRAKTELQIKSSPYVASFSSRGPNLLEQAILKPDVIAPGVSIIAAYTEATGPTNLILDKRRVSYNVQSGTSMSCPHASGIVGLLKTLHPDWSPAAIKSAIMTTATTLDNEKEPILDSSHLKATPFDYGSGHVQPNHATDPGLVYDLAINDYLNFLCARGYNESIIKLFSNTAYKCPKSFSLLDFNYPSIAVPNLNQESITIKRKVTNVGPPGTYNASVKEPEGVLVLVKPRSLNFKRTGEVKKFKIIFKPKIKGEPKDYAFGELIWSNNKQYVRSPLVVKHYKINM